MVKTPAAVVTSIFPMSLRCECLNQEVACLPLDVTEPAPTAFEHSHTKALLRMSGGRWVT